MNKILKKYVASALAGAMLMSGIVMPVSADATTEKEISIQPQSAKAEVGYLTDVLHTFDGDSSSYISNYKNIDSKYKGPYLSTEYSSSGDTSLAVVGSAYYKFPEFQAGKKITMKIYDPLNEAKEKIQVKLVNSKTSASAEKPYEGKEHLTICFSNGQGEYNLNDEQGYLSNDDRLNKDNIGRKQGWIEVVWDMTSGTHVDLYVDGKILNKQPIPMEGFDTIHIASWEDAYTNFPAYIDDLKIETEYDLLPPEDTVARDPMTYDTMNMFGFKYATAYPNINEYQYSIDGGLNWADCTSNPQPIPDGNYAAGDVQVRVYNNAEAGGGVYEVLKNDVAFTSNKENGDAYYDFEQNELPFTVENKGGKNEISKFGYGGEQSFGLINAGGIFQDIPLTDDPNVALEGKTASLWFYDTMGEECIRFGLRNASVNQNTSKPAETASQVVEFAVKDSKQYSYFYQDGSNNTGEVKFADRSEGWHKLTWDYTSGDTCVLYLDDNKVKEFSDVTGFNYLCTKNFWNGGNTFTFNMDDIMISSTGETYPKLSNAPSITEIDDENDAFSFGYVTGYTDVTDYEYSIDNGKTWAMCYSNPQPVGDVKVDAGELKLRVRANNGSFAGLKASSTEDFTSSQATLVGELKELVTFSSAMFKDNYKKEAWDSFSAIFENAKSLTSESSEEELSSAIKNLTDAIDVLGDNIVLENYTRYDFEAGEKALNPFVPVTGTMTVGEVITCSGKDRFVGLDEKHGVEVFGEEIDGRYKGEALYTFAKDIENKVVSYIWYPVQNGTKGSQVMKVENSKGDYVSITLPEGNQAKYQMTTCLNGEVKTTISPVRSISGPFYFHWDMTQEGETSFYMDGRNLATLEGMDSFNKISLAVDTTNEAEKITFDKLRILEKNPITSIELPKALKELGAEGIGYYDTLDIAPLNILNSKYYEDYNIPAIHQVKSTTLHEGYGTTDLVTFSSSNEDVVFVSNGGVCESVNPGTATITVTASGVSDTIDVTVKDFKVEDVFITDSPMVDVIAKDEPTQLVNSSKPVVDTESVIVDIDESKVLNAVITPANATARLVDWTSADEKIAIVKDGLVTGVGYGETTITIKSQDGTNKTDTIKVIVKADDLVGGVNLYVAKDGNDITGTGSIEKPFATIERARDEARTLCSYLPEGGVVVNFREGTYSISETVEFNDQDSGTEKAPITYAAYGDEKVTFIGGASFNATDMEKVDINTDVNKTKIHYAQDKLYKVNLADFGVSRRESPVLGGIGGFTSSEFGDAYWDFNFDTPYYSILANNEPMTLARFPNTGFIKTSTIVHAGENTREWAPDAVKNGWGHPYEPGMEDDTFIFTSSSLPSSKLAEWSESIIDNKDQVAKDGLWLRGFWGVVYTDHSVPVISVEGNKIKSGLNSAYDPKTNMNFYAYNLLEELDIPGEWYIDQITNPQEPVLYFYPPTDWDMNDASNEIKIPLLDEVMLELYETDYINFNGIDFTTTNNSIATITGGTYNVIRKAEIDNTIGKLMNIGNSKNEKARFNGVEMCTMTNIDGGISLGGGDTNTLERGYNYVENCDFFTINTVTKAYNPAVNLGGTGERVTNCYFTDTPQNVVMFSGTESTMEFLTFEKCVQETGDQAAIYTGRDTLHRGSIIRNSIFKDIDSTSVHNSGIYLDDAKAGVLITDNYFENMTAGITTGGGRDVVVIGNTFKDVDYGISTAPFAYIFSNHIFGSALCLYSDTSVTTITEEPWRDPSSAYGRFDDLYYTLDDGFGHGKYCKLIDNEFIDIHSTSPAGSNKYLWSKDWAIMPYADQVALINDWWMKKGNTPDGANEG